MTTKNIKTSTVTNRVKRDWGSITSKIKETENKVSYNKDDGYSDKLYTPKLEKDGTFQAIVRFVPRPVGDGDGVPFVKLMNHGFSDVGGWFIENCPTTRGDKCPVCTSNSVDWKAGNEDVSRKRARKTSYYSNLLIIKDIQTPENDGKVFIFRYGKKLHDKIMEKIAPPEGSIDEPVQVFDFVDGENFKLKISKTKSTIDGQVKEFNNYDASVFTGVASSIVDTAVAEKALEEKLHNLGVIISDDKFKSYDELEAKFLDKTGGSAVSRVVGQVTEKASSVKNKVEKETETDISDDDFFAKIREED